MTEIQLSRGKVALVDEGDLPRLLRYGRWRAFYSDGVWYASGYALDRTTKPTFVLMHRLILGLSKKDPPVDHRNGDGLDNRRSNLRLASATLNNANHRGYPSRRRSPYKGVSWLRNAKLRAGGQWRATIKPSAKAKQSVRYAPTEIEAAVEYNRLALQKFGTWSCLNLVPCSWPERV